MNININKRLLVSACAFALSLSAFGQQTTTITGKVVDADGTAIPGAAVQAVGTNAQTVTNAQGEYSLSLSDASSVKVSFIGYNAQDVLLQDGQNVYNVVLTVDGDVSLFTSQTLAYGAYKDFALSENTASVSVINSDRLDLRSAKNIANSILGQGNGLVSLEGSGTYFEQQPTLYVRGLQALEKSDPLLIVDGIEREIHTLVPSDVESVQILKDAAAVALFGYKGANGVIYIRTKRGPQTEGYSIKVGFDAAFNFQVDRPKFVDALTYAMARNEAIANDGGKESLYSEKELELIANGEMPDFYADVNWVDEVYKNSSQTRRYNIQFSGSGKRFHYFTSLNLLANDGFIKNPEENEGYSTQDMYSRGNLRSNLDIKLTDYTDLRIDISGVLSEMQCPGNKTDIWENIYKTPSIAFPIKTSKSDWGGSTEWIGTLNPVAQATGAGYYKIHERSLNTDVFLNQSLEPFVEGLRAYGRLAYDNYSTLYEDHSKTYVYGWNVLRDGEAKIKKDDGSINVDGYDYTLEGTSTELGTGSNTDDWARRARLEAGISFERQLTDEQKLFAQVRWDYDFSDMTGTNTTLHRHNVSWYSHYGLLDRYYLDLVVDASASNRLAPDTKWNVSPTVSAAWVISNEDFLSSDAVSLLKLRASFGKIATDWLPYEGKESDRKEVWNYFEQTYTRDNAYYPFGSDYSYGDNSNRVSLGRMAASNPTSEKAYKFNVGVDARLFRALDLQADFYMQHNKDAWVEGSGSYSAVIGFTAPFVNQGHTKSYGFEISADYTKTIGDLTFNVGGAFNIHKNEIVEKAEELRPFDNLVETGYRIKPSRGLKAMGLFQSQAEIDAAPQQTFGTVRPGDIRYVDVNGDGIINENDKCDLGFSSIAPDINYNFHLGAEFKGVGLSAFFQGVAQYSAELTTENYYWCLYDKKNLSQEVYDGRWNEKNPNAKYPRLSYDKSNNNYQKSDFWLADRSYLKLRNVELYYDFKSILEGNKVLGGARLFVRGIDLFTIDKIENRDAAEVGIKAPSTRSIAAGFSLTF